MPRFKIECPKLTITAHNDEGEQILYYNLEGYVLNADTKGLVDAGFAIAKQVTEQLAALEAPEAPQH